MDHIRNFCIIAHIDHGKSTLADRLIQRCGAVEAREFRDQILDSMDLERERGITIKANTVSLPYTARDGRAYELNLIDTPGHVDFSHEVRRSLMSCEGALLVVDASQGVEAQTVANLYLAMEFGLEVVPVINKIDLPSADVDRVMEEIDRDLGLDPFASIQVSAKLGTGIDELLEAIVQHLPAPKGDPKAPLRALLFDAQYDAYLGAVLLVRLLDGTLRAGTRVRLMHASAEHKVEEVGCQRLKRVPVPQLAAGEVGYVLAGIKSLSGLAIGDTLYSSGLAQMLLEIENTLAGAGGRVISRALVEEMVKPHIRLRDLGLEGWEGLSLFLTEEEDGWYCGHGGSNEGYRAQFILRKGKRQAAVIMTNADSGSELTNAWMGTVALEYGWTGFAYQPPAVFALDPASLAAFAGSYRSQDGLILEIKFIQGVLTLLYADQPALGLLPRGERRFFCPHLNLEVAFTSQNGLVLRQNGEDLAFNLLGN